MLVLTGGPCSGKTTILRALDDMFGERLVVVPEMASVLLKGGFPAPGKDVEWSPEWQEAFQEAVLPMQRSFERAHALAAEARGRGLVVCDRGLLDGAAYTPGGLAEFCKKFGVDAEEAYRRYEAVIHLESLATYEPERYGKGNNEMRFEPLEDARRLEYAAREAWRGHRRWVFIEGKQSVASKISEVTGIVRFLLA